MDDLLFYDIVVFIYVWLKLEGGAIIQLFWNLNKFCYDIGIWRWNEGWQIHKVSNMKIVHYISFDTDICNFDPMLFHNESWSVIAMIGKMITFKWSWSYVS